MPTPIGHVLGGIAAGYLVTGLSSFESQTCFAFEFILSVVAINSLLYDPYSLFYYFRTLDLVSGKTIDLTVFDNKSLTEFQMIIASKERISVPAGAFDCMVVRPFREGKMLLKNEGDMTIWFSNDVHKIPVQIVLKIKYGTMVMKLKTFNL